jgi:hypothetical protein
MAHAAHETKAYAMTDTPPPKRRFWQIHLSSVMVGVFIVSTLMFLNLRERLQYHQGYFGFPWDMAVRVTSATELCGLPADYFLWESESVVIAVRPAMHNIGLGLGCLLCGVVMSEYVIRRRSKP